MEDVLLGTWHLEEAVDARRPGARRSGGGVGRFDGEPHALRTVECWRRRGGRRAGWRHLPRPRVVAGWLIRIVWPGIGERLKANGAGAGRGILGVEGERGARRREMRDRLGRRRRRRRKRGRVA